MSKYIILLFLLFLEGLMLSAQPVHTAAEYFFDIDSGYGNGIPLQVTNATEIDEGYSVDISSLSAGIHQLYLRTKDANGRWSQTSVSNFFKTPAASGPPPVINHTAAEYFFDMDPGYGNGIPLQVTNAMEIDEDYSVDISSLSAGIHQFYLRTKDANGRWSQTSVSNFFKTPAVSGPPPVINHTAAEYFFDMDPGYGNGIPLQVTSAIEIDEDYNLDISNLTTGTHQLYVRTKDANGQWSQIIVEEFEKEVGPCHPDSLALMALYNATNGANWTNNTNWGMDCDVCNWYGITCENENVTKINLSSNNLTGTLPSEIGNLTNLSILNLWVNQLSGEIPAELGALTNLTELYLNSNNLTGTLPSEIGSLINLSILILWDNQLSGEIPAELGALTNLTELFFSNNQLSGTIPEEFGNLTELLRLGLNGNLLSGKIPAELGALTNLTELFFSNNQLSGTIPEEFGNLTELLRLGLSGNQLSGEIPAELGALTNLTELFLSSNQLSGTIPKELGNLADLTELYLQINQLTGTIPKELGKLTNLSELLLNSNQLVGVIPEEFGNLTSLSRLYLLRNQLEGCIPMTLNVLCGQDVNISNNPNLDEQDFDAFCATNSGICTTMGTQWENLFTNVDTLWSNGAPGPIRINNSEVIPLIVATTCDNVETPIYAIGKMHGQGNIIGMSNERVIIDDSGGIDAFDNQQFFENAFELLNNGNGKQVGLVNYWAGSNNMTTIIAVLEAKGFTFTNLTTPLTTAQLNNLDVLFIGNDWRNEGTIDQAEVDIVENFVQNGGGALLMGLGWSWPNDLADYPMNRFASSFGFEFIPNYFIEPVNVYNQWPYFVNIYPNIDLDAICPPFVCPTNRDSLALMTIYNAANGENWTNNTNWGTCDPCTWYGVECNEGRVIRLDLTNNNLVGNIPEEIGQLDQVSTLRLGENQLSGSVPSSIGNLVRMSWLELRDNNLSGTFPDVFFNWSDLHDIRVNNNDFIGMLPPSLGYRTTLRVAEFYNNNFSGCFPYTYRNLCTNKENVFESGFSFFDNQQLPNNGDFDAFCADGTGSCEEEIGCNWVELEIATGTGALDLFFQFSTFDEQSIDPFYRSGYNFGTNSPNATLIYRFQLSSETHVLRIANQTDNPLENFQLRSMETGIILATNPPNANASDLSIAFDVCPMINECPEEVSINVDLSSDTTIQASQQIIANSAINSTFSVTFLAGQTIRLTPDFHAAAGANFTARIADCATETILDKAAVLVARTISTSSNNLEDDLADTSLSASDVLMFPNPTTATVTIEVTKPITGQVMLYNSFGQQLAVQAINPHNTILDLSTYPTGVYWVALSDMEQKKRIVKKIVKQ